MAYLDMVTKGKTLEEKRQIISGLFVTPSVKAWVEKNLNQG